LKSSGYDKKSWSVLDREAGRLKTRPLEDKYHPVLARVKSPEHRMMVRSRFPKM